MRQYKIDLGAIDATPATADSGGGCVTWTFPTIATTLGDAGGNEAGSAYWYTKSQMNLVQFDVNGSFFNLAEGPLYIELQTFEGTIASISIEEEASSHETWTGLVPVAPGTPIRLWMYGGGEFVTEGDAPVYYHALCTNVCVSAWFDGEAGGGLNIYPQPGG